MSGAEGQHELEALLAEQTAYYRARAPEYLDDALEELGRDVLAGAGRELLAARDGFAPRRDVLELAGALKPDGRVRSSTMPRAAAGGRRLELPRDRGFGAVLLGRRSAHGFYTERLVFRAPNPTNCARNA